MTRRPLDAELVRRGLALSRIEARDAVGAGRVTVSGVIVTKAASLVADDVPVALAGPPRPFVSRAGSKLAAALDRFAIDPTGMGCLDVGASTGGFTDCLLQRGAARVIALDVGYGQLAWSLRSEPKVVVMERVNVRDLTPSMLAFSPELVVADLSFISLRLVMPTLATVGSPGTRYVLLVKPQFEARRDRVGRGGVVRDPDVWRSVLSEVITEAGKVGLGARAVMASPLPGPAGNAEFPLYLGHDDTGPAIDLAPAILEGTVLTG